MTFETEKVVYITIFLTINIFLNYKTEEKYNDFCLYCKLNVYLPVYQIILITS